MGRNAACSADDATYWRTGYIPVDASKVYHLSCYAMSQWATASVYLGVECYNASGTIIAGGNVYVLGGFQGLTGTYQQYGGTIGPGQPVNFHAGTVKVRIIWIGAYLQAGGSMATRFCFNEGKVPSKSVLPPDLIGQHNPITPSNVTTYIDNAALGNAQIGGNLWSTNWNYAGGTGWLLDRSGNFYGNNIYARGDIEASSLKAGVAMVDSLHLKGNAVIIPLQISYGAKSVNLPYSQGAWQVANAFQYTLSLSGGGLFKLSFTGTFTIDHWNGHANYGLGSLTKVVRIYVNGSLVETVITNLPAGASSIIAAATIGDKFYWLGAGSQTILIRMEALMADGGARVACSAGTVSIQSFQTGSSSV